MTSSQGIIVPTVNETTEEYGDNTVDQIAFSVGVRNKENMTLYFDFSDIPGDPCAAYHDKISVPYGDVTPGTTAVCILRRNNPDNLAIAHVRFHWGDPFFVHVYVTYSSSGYPAIYCIITEDSNWYISDMSVLRQKLQQWQDVANVPSGLDPAPIDGTHQIWNTDTLRPEKDPDDVYWGEYGFYLREKDVPTSPKGIFCHVNVKYEPVPPAVKKDMQSRKFNQEKLCGTKVHGK